LTLACTEDGASGRVHDPSIGLLPSIIKGWATEQPPHFWTIALSLLRSIRWETVQALAANVYPSSSHLTEHGESLLFTGCSPDTCWRLAGFKGLLVGRLKRLLCGCAEPNNPW